MMSTSNCILSDIVDIIRIRMRIRRKNMKTNMISVISVRIRSILTCLLELPVELGLQRVILELDCQGLMKLIKDPAAMRSSIRGLCFDISELGKSFSDFRVEWVRREANSVAHICAHMVSATERCLFWLDLIPD